MNREQYKDANDISMEENNKAKKCMETCGTSWGRCTRPPDECPLNVGGKND